MRRFVNSIWGLSKSGRKVQVGIGIIIFFILVAIFSGPLVSLIGHGQDPLGTATYLPWQHPSKSNLLGTDRYGRDILAMTIKATGASLEVGIVSALVSTVVGVIVAFVAGYKGGKLDSFLSGTTDVFLVVPSFPLLITLSAYVSNVNIITISLILAIFSWPFAARTIRSQVLSLRTRPYVELAKVTRLNDLEIIFQELVPNLLPFIGVGFASSALGSIFALVGLEVIGLGPGNIIDLGLMLNWSISFGALSLGAWTLFAAPIFVLTMLFFAVNLVNIGLEETYNPRLRKTAGA